MDQMMFTQVVARLRVLETRLLDKAKIDRMIDSSSAQDALKVLQESEYAALMSNLKRAEDYEDILSDELKRVYNLLYDVSPLKAVIDIMSLKYDYHNIKVLIKGKLLDKDFSHMLIPVASVDVEKLKYYMINEDYRDLNPIMKEAIEKAFADFESTKDPQRIDIILDGYLYKHMLEVSKEIGSTYLDKYIRSSIDLTNIKSLIRIKKQNKDREFLNSVIIDGGYVDRDKLVSAFNDSIENLVGKLSYTDYHKLLKLGIEEYSKTNSIRALEKLSDNFIMDYMKEAKYVSFGLEPLIAYLIAKETEIKIIRIIMVGKLNNVAPEVIRERLRDSYV